MVVQVKYSIKNTSKRQKYLTEIELAFLSRSATHLLYN